MGYADLKFNEEQGNKKEEKWDDCGTAIMTNSAAGFTVWAKVFHAICYLKSWAAILSSEGRTPLGKVPFCAYGVKIDQNWVEWRVDF
jgi:hypothetical protein